MKFLKTKLGAYLIELNPYLDDRGSLVRTWSKDEFKKNGIKLDLKQGFMSHTLKKGTIRGIHCRAKPPFIAQLTKHLTGSYFEIIVDLRPESKTYKKWEGFVIDGKKEVLLYVPERFAHAILSLEDKTSYMNYYSGFFDPKKESGIRYDDPTFNFKWPITVSNVSEKDKSWPDFKE